MERCICYKKTLLMLHRAVKLLVNILVWNVRSFNTVRTSCMLTWHFVYEHMSTAIYCIPIIIMCDTIWKYVTTTMWCIVTYILEYFIDVVIYLYHIKCMYIIYIILWYVFICYHHFSNMDVLFRHESHINTNRLQKCRRMHIAYM